MFLCYSNTTANSVILAQGIFYGVFSIIAIFGNGLVVIVTIRTPQLHSASNLLIGLLCFVDLLYALGHGVWVSVASFTGSWLGGDRGLPCKISSYTSVMWTGMLFMLLAVISLDKLIAIKYPLQYRKLINRRTVLLMWISTIIAPVFLIAVPIIIFDFMNWVSHEFVPTYGQCTLFFRVNDNAFVSLHDYPILLLPYLLWTLTQALPLLIIIICYSFIFYEVRQQIKKSRSLGGMEVLRSYKAVTTIFLIIVTFLVTWLPEYLYDLLIMVHYIDPRHESEGTFSLSLITRWLYYLSPTVDPYIYGIRHKRLRTAIKQMFCFAKHELIPSNSDVISRTLRRLSHAVANNIPEIQLRGARLFGSVSESVTSLFSSSEGNPVVPAPGELTVTKRTNRSSKPRPNSLAGGELRSLDRIQLRTLIKRPRSQQMCRKVSVVLEDEVKL